MVGPAMAANPNNPPPSPEDSVSFGFQDVPRTEKKAKVRSIFDRVANKYDLMNDAMSMGLHRVWKDIAAARLNPQPGERILDIAGGTGDIARRLHKRAQAVRARRGGEPAEIVVLDINQEMLAAGRAKGVDDLLWACGDAERLPAPTASADAVIIAFGIRNVTTIENALLEMRRVLKPGGRFFCLEFSKFAIGSLRPVYDAYSFNVIPAVGKRLAGDADAYTYLVESIRRFPDQERFAAMIRQAGFNRVGYENLAGGVCALHRGWAV
jgi:demethylmenaquinone methyltransferase / 2-methoxy-6-polyprenyl-1,4-benzoquinol methylase